MGHIPWGEFRLKLLSSSLLPSLPSLNYRDYNSGIVAISVISLVLTVTLSCYTKPVD